MSDPKCARMLVEAAQRDVLTLRSMTAGAPEESFGFHVQQAAEKALKAWLAFDSVAGPQPGGTVQRAASQEWREMQRQHERIQELRDLFRDVPEALLWR